MKKTSQIFFISSLFFLLLILGPLKAKAADGCCIIDDGQTIKFATTSAEYCADLNNRETETFWEADKVADNDRCKEKKVDKLGTSLPKFGDPINNPILSVRIPGFSGFKNVTCETTINAEGKPVQECSIPWLAEYIGALYKYGIGAILILAVVIIMIGGVIWLTAAGNDKRVNDAKNWISGSLFGVLIALSSYMILTIINPALTQLSPIKITTIKKADLLEMVIGPDEEDGTTGTPNETSKGTSGTSEKHCDCPWDIQFSLDPNKSIVYPKGGNIYSHGCGAVSSWDLVKCKGKNYTLEDWIKVLAKVGAAAGSGGSDGSKIYKALADAGLQADTFHGSDVMQPVGKTALSKAVKKMEELKDKNPMLVIGVRGVNKGGKANCQFTKNGHFIFGVKLNGDSLCINDPSNSKGANSRKDAKISQIEQDCVITNVAIAW